MRIKFTPDPDAPKPYDYDAVQGLAQADAARLSEQIAKQLKVSPWLKILLASLREKFGIVNKFCQPMSAKAIAFAEALPFTTYTHGYAQRILLVRGGDASKYIPLTGVFYTDRTKPTKNPDGTPFLAPGEQILETEPETYSIDPVEVYQETHCPYPLDALPPSREDCLLPPPIFEGQFIRHDVYDARSIRRGLREYVSVRLQDGLEWMLLSGWTLDNTTVQIKVRHPFDIL